MVEALRKQLDTLHTQLKASEELEEVRMAVSRAIVRLEDARDREARMAHELNNAIRAVNEVRGLGEEERGEGRVRGKGERAG